MSDNGSVVLSKEERDLIATFGFNFMNYYKDTLFGGNLGAVGVNQKTSSKSIGNKTNTGY